MKTITLNYYRNTLNLASILLIALFCFAGSKTLSAQNVGINTTGATPKSSAILDLNPNTTQGLLPPKVALSSTATASPITNPNNGLLVYDTLTTTTGGTGAEGFYYWNGSAWVSLQGSSSTQPYGYDVQYVIGTTDATTTSTSYVAVPQMTITFIPVHNTIYLTFTASGYTTTADAYQYIAFKVLKNGANATTTGFETGATAEVSDDVGHVNSAWNCSIFLPISVTAGTAVTISIDWYTDGPDGENTVENLVNSVPTKCHRTMFIND